MTRSNTPLARSSLLRQLKRVNNKSRFRIFQGDLTGAETLFIDEGKLSWGIDKEDVNVSSPPSSTTTTCGFPFCSTASPFRGMMTNMIQYL
jgi:hypothetical protein